MAYLDLPPLARSYDRVQGKIILITGSSSGIGAAAARLFAKEGARVICAARLIGKLKLLVDELTADGAEALAIECDVTNEDSIEKTIDAGIRRFGALDGAFNCAGIGPVRTPIQELNLEDFDAILSTNLRATVACMKHEVKAMLIFGRGSIVNVSSIAGLVAGATNTSYAAAKWGLAGATKCSALDVARRSIRINAIAPGPTRSEAFDAWLPTEADRERVAESFPMNYIAHPEDMARVALFLLSDESRWMTGAILPCDGGKSLM